MLSIVIMHLSTIGNMILKSEHCGIIGEDILKTRFSIIIKNKSLIHGFLKAMALSF